jgi:hypothetical protein
MSVQLMTILFSWRSVKLDACCKDSSAVALSEQICEQCLAVLVSETCGEMAFLIDCALHIK